MCTSCSNMVNFNKKMLLAVAFSIIIGLTAYYKLDNRRTQEKRLREQNVSACLEEPVAIHITAPSALDLVENLTATLVQMLNETTDMSSHTVTANCDDIWIDGIATEPVFVEASIGIEPVLLLRLYLYGASIGIKPVLLLSQYWYGGSIGMEPVLVWSQYWYGASIGMEPVLVLSPYWYEASIGMEPVLVLSQYRYRAGIVTEPVLVWSQYWYGASIGIEPVLLLSKYWYGASMSQYWNLA
ncbi:hypothetical protein Bpfe_004687 [Biomphalaria pfeifferi]|uniref:Uncharacterized protein n=1 Tax=Biomphalaria pfeifferi TaxID=112525 RepID=A0AAD8C457_BIOPF|nr:hypothetical protein Bpfe_004687 [Biomphalaria pfeifferi]